MTRRVPNNLIIAESDIRCPIILILSLSFREVYARDAFECYRGPTMPGARRFRLDRKRRFRIHRVVCASTPSFHLKLQTTVRSLLAVKESANVSRE